MRAMIVPDATPTCPIRMIQAPIATLIIGGQDIDRGGGKRGQVRATLPFKDHEGVQKLGLLEKSIQTIEREHTQSSPLGGEMLLTPTRDIVSHLIVGMKVLAVVGRVRFKRQSMHRPGLTIDARFGLLGYLIVRHAFG